MLPAAFDLARLERDTAISVALFNMLTVLGKLWDSVNDTLQVVGGPAVLVGAEANSHIKLVSESARRLAPTDRASRGRSSAKLPITPSTPVQVEPPQLVESARELPTDPARKAA